MSAMCAAIQARESGLLRKQGLLRDITSQIQNNQIVKLSIVKIVH